MKCHHPYKQRHHVSSTLSICKGCGMAHAMIAGRTSVRRMWVATDDPRIERGAETTHALLALARMKVNAT